jgi:hypothetical protein
MFHFSINDRKMNLGHINELGRQNIASLALLKNYKLGVLKVESEMSRVASVFAAIDHYFDRLDQFEQTRLVETVPDDPQKLAHDLNINIIVWSAVQIKLYNASKSESKIDMPTVMIFQNKYGQYYPIIRQNGARIHRVTDSTLLIKLLNTIK